MIRIRSFQPSWRRNNRALSQHRSLTESFELPADSYELFVFLSLSWLISKHDYERHPSSKMHHCCCCSCITNARPCLSVLVVPSLVLLTFIFIPCDSLLYSFNLEKSAKQLRDQANRCCTCHHVSYSLLGHMMRKSIMEKWSKHLFMTQAEK